MRVAKLNCIVTAIAACLPMAAANASEIAPAKLVENYINLSVENPEQSKTLLVPDATVIIFDYGLPLAENFPEFVKLLPGSDCSKPLIRSEGKAAHATGVHADAVIVRVEWQCTKPTESVLASNVLRFIVAQQKIAIVVFEDPPGYPPQLNSGNANTGDR
ncbi:hypothetical protein [Mesorhizobium sp.]|uniref:hypothetical protein n=1 Tax=Mesorhizobium sp. TaxID=1871066 RepID=UPI000FE9A1A6|nr:hypothetical protein [Mesorhizobium sp.]RWD69522.1 MAG: hypothetical protein EOS37_17860 [Mesorhizobium sp.]RWE75957.1 MAG: hypothetical protein EOS42_12615 [Mesorhizobium sp.]TIV31400.1 MAG: hypothetical protein E5V90_07345 [Mesorhizobium sp.]TIV59830.1 MAG: hypothetical protein E5V80_12245 [Mesorhizobium sp.]